MRRREGGRLGEEAGKRGMECGHRAKNVIMGEGGAGGGHKDRYFYF